MACKQFARRFAYSLLTMGHVDTGKKSKVGFLVGLFSAISFLQLALSGHISPTLFLRELRV